MYTANEIAEEIRAGSFDSELTALKEAVDARIKARRVGVTLKDFPIGATVRFNDLTGTRYMVGQEATVMSHRVSKLVVRPNNPIGRFHKANGDAANIVVPPAIVDLVRVGA